MGQVTLSMPDAIDNRVLNAVAARHAWTPGSGLTKLQFFKKHLIDLIIDDVRWFESQSARESHRLAGEAAAKSASDTVDVEVVIT